MLSYLKIPSYRAQNAAPKREPRRPNERAEKFRIFRFFFGFCPRGQASLYAVPSAVCSVVPRSLLVCSCPCLLLPVARKGGAEARQAEAEAEAGHRLAAGNSAAVTLHGDSTLPPCPSRGCRGHWKRRRTVRCSSPRRARHVAVGSPTTNEPTGLSSDGGAIGCAFSGWLSIASRFLLPTTRSVRFLVAWAALRCVSKDRGNKDARHLFTANGSCLDGRRWWIPSLGSLVALFAFACSTARTIHSFCTRSRSAASQPSACCKHCFSYRARASHMPL
jgi:hypothetical protein